METGLTQMSRIFFHSYDEFSHQCKCVQKWSSQQFMNTNTNYYSILQQSIQICQLFPGMCKYVTSCFCTHNNAIINLKHWWSFSTSTQYPHNIFNLVQSTDVCKNHIHNSYVQKLSHNHETIGKPYTWSIQSICIQADVSDTFLPIYYDVHSNVSGCLIHVYIGLFYLCSARPAEMWKW